MPRPPNQGLRDRPTGPMARPIAPPVLRTGRSDSVAGRAGSFDPSDVHPWALVRPVGRCRMARSGLCRRRNQSCRAPPFRVASPWRCSAERHPRSSCTVLPIPPLARSSARSSRRGIARRAFLRFAAAIVRAIEASGGVTAGRRILVTPTDALPGTPVRHGPTDSGRPGQGAPDGRDQGAPDGPPLRDGRPSREPDEPGRMGA